MDAPDSPAALPPAPSGLRVTRVRAYLPGETRAGLRASWDPVPGAAHYGVTVTTRAGGTVRLRVDETSYEWVADPRARYRVRVNAVAPGGRCGESCEDVVTAPCVGDGQPP